MNQVEPDSRLRVLLVYKGYPTISQTYMLNEVDAVADDFEVKVVSIGRCELPTDHHHDFIAVGNDLEMLDDIVREFRPDLLHGHYLERAPLLAKLGERHGVPFTCRAHSFDVLKHRGRKARLDYETRAVNSDACLGLLTFPFGRPILEDIGIRSDKLIDCRPVIRYDRFYDRSPNGGDVMNIGAVIPKKRMNDFVDLGLLTDRKLRLYTAGYGVDKLQSYNESQGSPIEICASVQPEQMPAVYKQHEWLVYTGDFEHAAKHQSIGWPMAVAEAQASGVGVIVPNVRPDLREYVGEAGFLYDSIDEVPAIISQPFPDELREIGFEHAKKSAIENHIGLLTDLWRSTETSPSKPSHQFTRYRQATAPVRLAQSLLKRAR